MLTPDEIQEYFKCLLADDYFLDNKRVSYKVFVFSINQLLQVMQRCQNKLIVRKWMLYSNQYNKQ